MVAAAGVKFWWTKVDMNDGVELFWDVFFSRQFSLHEFLWRVSGYWGDSSFLDELWFYFQVQLESKSERLLI